MTPFDRAQLRILLDELANALQVVVILAEHLERASAATAQDATAIAGGLRRATAALQKLQAAGGAR